MQRTSSLMLPSSTGRGLGVSRRKRFPNRALTEAQIRILLTSIENIRDDALIQLGLSVGLRVSEVVGVRTSEIDFDRGLIKIWDEKKDKWGLVTCAGRIDAAAEGRIPADSTSLGLCRAGYV